MAQNFTNEGANASYAAIDSAELASRSFLLLAMVLAVGGLLINAFTLVAICAVRMKVQWLRLSLASLCVADACTCVATLALTGIAYHNYLSAHYEHENSLQHRTEFCLKEIFRLMWDASTSASMYTLSLMAVQLFASVRWPLRSELFLSQRASVAMLAGVWLVAAAVGFLPAVLVAVSAQHERLQMWREKTSSMFCYQFVLYKQTIAASASGVTSYKYHFGQQLHDRAQVLLGLCASAAALATIVGSYGYILTVVRAKVVFSKSQQRSDSSSKGEGGGGEVAEAKERRLAMFVVLITALFLAGYLPLYTFMMITSFLDGRYGNRVTFSALMALSTLSPIADPLLYCIRLKEIRAGLQGALRRATHCCCLLVRRRSDSISGSARIQSARSADVPLSRRLLPAS